MSKYDREAMIAEAIDLGLDFKGNISNKNLAAMLADFKGEPPPVDEPAPPSPPERELSAAEIVAAEAQAKAQEKFRLKREKIAAAKARAMKKHVVTITNKDNRENDVMTTVYLGFENQHFGVSKLVPLDTPVELEQALINIAANTTMTLHKDEIVDGKRTGNKVPTRVKKFAISYHRNQPEDNG